MTRAVALVLAVAAACAPGWKQRPHDRRFQAATPPSLHPPPVEIDLSDWWDRALHGAVIPLGRALSPARYASWLVGGRPALDVNAFGQVPDSAWFTNRIGRQSMPPEQIAQGPGGAGGPPAGTLTVISGKLEGATPGVVARDASGVVWFVKFDPPANRELATGAEVIGARLLHAAGYWVPEVYVDDVDIRRFVLGRDASRRDDYNRLVPMTEPDLSGLLANLNPDGAGRLRAVFSRSVPGRPVGPFSYRGIRADDPNDRVPHERRRSLRGLRVFSAWLNNTDPRSQNTLDTFLAVDPRGRRGSLRHYLIDFGDSLGSGGERVKYPGEGYEGTLDWRQIGKRGASLGLVYPYWLGVRSSPRPAVGRFEAEQFDPERWQPTYPNPAFAELTDEDAFWAATILARFSRARVRAAITAARYTDPGAAREIEEVLMARRDEILRRAFASRLALDDPRVEQGTRLALTDLELVAGLRAGTLYRWSARWNRTRRPDRTVGRGQGDSPHADLGPALARLLREHRSEFARDPFLSVRFRRRGHPSAVTVHLRVVGNHILPVALTR